MIRGFLFFIFLIVFSLFMEMIFSYHFHLSFFMPDFFFVFVMYSAWYKGPVYGEIAGFFAGMVKDTFGVGIFGVNMFIYTVFGYFMGELVKSVGKNEIRHQILAGFLFSVFYMFLFYLINIVFGYKLSMDSRLIYFLKPIINAFCIPFIFMFYNSIEGKLFRASYQ